MAFPFLAGIASCEPFDRHTPENSNPGYRQDSKTTENMIRIIIGSSTFTIVLADNAAAKAFKAMLPLTLRMSDVNGNEKYATLHKPLPSSASCPGTIHAGDLMLWGSDGLVLFYETFPTPYSYTPLGRISDASELIQAFDSEKANVTFELK